MLLSRLFTAVVLIGALSGCGFQPLYATSQKVPESRGFSDVYIKQVKDRIGQQFRNALIDMINPQGEPHRPAYELQATLTVSQQGLAVQKSASATRANARVNVSFSLIDIKSKETVWSGAASSVASYNILDSEYATLRALENVRARAVRQLAEDVRIRLGVYFHRIGNNQPAAKK